MQRDSDFDKALGLAVDEDNFEAAKEALLNHANPNCSYEKQNKSFPVIFFVKSIEMLNLLLNHGANPEIGEDEHLHLLDSFLRYNQFGLMTALVCHPKGVRNDAIINDSLLQMFRKIFNKNKFSSQDEVVQDAAIALMRTSSNLKADVYSPYYYVTSLEKYDLLEVMINNNYHLWETLKYEQSKLIFKDADINDLIDKSTLTRIYDFRNLQLFLLATRDDKSSSVYGLPKELMHIIIYDLFVEAFSLNDIGLFSAYVKHNAQLAPERDLFIKKYTELKENKSISFTHTFTEDHKHLSNVSFFDRAKEKAYVEPKGLTALALYLSHVKPLAIEDFVEVSLPENSDTAGLKKNKI